MPRKNKRHKKNLRTSKVLIWGFLVLTVSGLGASYFFLATPETDAAVVMIVDPNVGLEAQVSEFFEANGAPEMIPIIKCESNFRHYNPNGSILQNRAGSSAMGIAQIMSSVHPDPKVLKKYNRKFDTDLTVDDFDILTLEGNLGYALMLYELRGTRDWECSKKFRFN